MGFELTDLRGRPAAFALNSARAGTLVLGSRLRVYYSREALVSAAQPVAQPTLLLTAADWKVLRRPEAT